MGWVKMSDARADHPKLLAAGLAARGLDEAAICWSSSHLTDGYLPLTAVIMLAAGHGEKNWKKLAGRLVEVGRWENATNGDGYLIHDYLSWQRSRADVDAERNAVKQRVKRHRNAVTPPVGNAECNPPGNGTQKQKQTTEAEAAASEMFTHNGSDPSRAAAAEDLIEKALNLLVDRRIATSKRPVDNPGRYRTAALAGLRDEHAEFFGSDTFRGGKWTPEQLANWLEPAPVRPREPRPLLRDEHPPCDQCDGAGVILEDDGRTARQCEACR